MGTTGRWKMAMAGLLLVASAVTLAGCNDVLLSPKYDTLLDQTVDLSAATASRAKAGKLTSEDMVQALDYQAFTWLQFQHGRDGVKGDVPAAAPTTQPTAMADLVPAATAGDGCK